MRSTDHPCAGHVVLLGDSVFDNGAYVAGGPDVVTQLRPRLPQGWRATLAALDGAVTADVLRQTARVPKGTTHLVVSVGGNDALRAEGLFLRRAASVGEALGQLARARDEFAAEYRRMLDAVLAPGMAVTLCTIYDPRFPDRMRQTLAITGLALFNDVILREAVARGLPVLDLRLICDDERDYANPIEPSVRGGAKIADAMAELLAGAGSGQLRGAMVVGGRQAANGSPG